jgi:ABC-2 type transport system permease protein
MSVIQTWRILKKDLWMGPRSGLFLWMLAIPLIMTLLVQVVFGSLFEPRPRLAVVDAGESEIRSALLATEGLEVTVLDSAAELKDGVQGDDFDGGLVLSSGFDEQLRAGARPLLELFVGGESHVSERLLIAVTTIDLVRQVEGSAPPVEVAIERLGNGELLPLTTRLVPFCVIYALLGSGIFLTGLMFVEEKEKGTLSALRVAPLHLREVVLAKWVLGFVLAVMMSLITLALNGGFGGQALTVTLSVVVGAALAAEIGILLGIVAADSTTLFALIKGLGILIIGPVVFYIFPEWPQWIAKLFPTYWVIDPIYSSAVLGNGLGEVWIDLAIALAIIVGLLPVIVAVTRRMQSRSALGAA